MKYLTTVIVQENASQKKIRDGQNATLSCTIKVLNCPQTGTKDDHPILRKDDDHSKGSQLDSTTYQQNWSKQVERM